MILSSDKKDKKFQLNINDSTISSEDSVTHLGIEIDSKFQKSYFYHLQKGKQTTKRYR